MNFVQTLGHLKGWTFHSADFREQAANKSKVGTVILTRSHEQFIAWSKLSPQDKERFPLMLSAFGHTLPEAVINAALAAVELPAVPLVETA